MEKYLKRIPITLVNQETSLIRSKTLLVSQGITVYVILVLDQNIQHLCNYFTVISTGMMQMVTDILLANYLDERW